jgi:hypothetical protein
MMTLRSVKGLAFGSILLLAGAVRAQAAGGPAAGTRGVPAALVPLLRPAATAGAAPATAAAATAAPRATPAWPSAAEQLARDGVQPGSALETLILAHQDFSLLRPGEAADGNPIPPWLRVLWRQAHPRGHYRASDPTGGYPLVLREIHEWLVSHQDLARSRQPAAAEEQAAPAEAGEERISGAEAVPRSESAIRINPFDPAKVIAASNNIGGNGQEAIFYSTDGGATWGQSSLPLESDDLFASDPTVEWTSDGSAWSTVIAITTMFGLQVRAYRSSDNGVTWTFDATLSGSDDDADKEMLWADHSAASPFKDNIYEIWHNDVWALIARRTGPGGAWQNPVLVSGPETTGTPIGGAVVTNSAGDLFGFWPDTTSQNIYVVKSTDGGVSFSAPAPVAPTFGSFQVSIPANNLRNALIYVSAAAHRTAGTNDVYVTWNDLSGDPNCNAFFLNPVADAANPCKTRIWFARSTDGGTTWSAPSKIHDPNGLNDQFFQWLTVDDATGRLAIIYYDTIKDPSRLSTNVFYQTSDDGGTTWSAPFQVTSASTNETVSGADTANQYGDYTGLSGLAGTLFPTWTDRRSGAREEIWTAAIADAGACSSTAVTTLTARPQGGAGVVLRWSQVVGATYEVYRAPASGGPYSLVATTTASSFADPAGPCGARRFYVVRAVAGCASALSNEVSYLNRPPVVLYSSNFDNASNGLDGWSVGDLFDVGTTSDWWGVQACMAHSAPNSFRFGSPSCSGGAQPGDLLSAQPGGAAGIFVPTGSTQTRLSFWHAYNFRPFQGGGTLVFSVNQGPLYLVAPQTITGTSYTPFEPFFSSCGPPGSESTYGIPNFTGDSAGFVNTVVDLGANCTGAGTLGCGGASLAIGFTAITDCSTPPQGGWYLDDVVVTTCPAAPPLTVTAGTGFYTLPPCRLVDTRQAAGPLGGPALAAQSTRDFVLAGSCGVPATARSLSVNVTVVTPAAAGVVNLYADDQPPPITSTINFAAGQVLANSAIVSLGSGTGGIRVANGSSAAVNLVLDVNGYFQ